MTYDVISTGSTGNAVIIDGQILIDCGVSYKKLGVYVTPLLLVLLTHRHSDHFRPATISALHKTRPTLRFGCCPWMVDPLLEAGVHPRSIDLFYPGREYRYPRFSVRPEPLRHNVPNCGYHITNAAGEKLFYATDTGTLEGIQAKNYDLYLVEANHTKEELQARLAAKQAAGEFSYEWNVAENHLSREQAENWIYQNIGPKGRYAFLHQHIEKRGNNHAET